MNRPDEVRNARCDLLAVLREHAYGDIAWEETLTITPTDHGARVPAHWVNDTDARIASVLPDRILREEIARRERTTP